MDQNSLRERITDQFSYRGERADIWRALDFLLETDEFLNLGYSEWYRPHALGSSQRRLATKVGSRVASHLSTTDGMRLLDVGCGRGGAAISFANQFGFCVTGLDLVPYNIGRATENAREKHVETEFVVGDATQLPFATNSFTACTAIDALVYLPNQDSVFAAVADVLEPEGIFVLSDLVMQSNRSKMERGVVDSFADVWDMPLIRTVEQYAAALEDTDLELKTVESITAHSIDRFRKWTTLYLGLLGSPVRPFLERFLQAYDLNLSAITKQVRAAHRALPFLEHVIFVVKAKAL